MPSVNRKYKLHITLRNLKNQCKAGIVNRGSIKKILLIKQSGIKSYMDLIGNWSRVKEKVLCF